MEINNQSFLIGKRLQGNIMGSPVSQVASSTQPQGKGGYQLPQPGQQNPADMVGPAVQQTGQFQQGSGKGGRVTFPSQNGQPQMGQPNNYSNTVGQWDNASIQPHQRPMGGGKGKG